RGASRNVGRSRGALGETGRATGHLDPRPNEPRQLDRQADRAPPGLAGDLDEDAGSWATFRYSAGDSATDRQRPGQDSANRKHVAETACCPLVRKEPGTRREQKGGGRTPFVSR